MRDGRHCVGAAAMHVMRMTCSAAQSKSFNMVGMDGACMQSLNLALF